MTTRGEIRPWGVGMPAWLQLHQFGDVLISAFGDSACLVGSALRTKQPRDIDVRMPVFDSFFMDTIGPMETFGKHGTKWAAFALAFSALGTQMTGLPIDFQIQPTAVALVYQGDPKLWLGTKDGDR